MSEVRKKGPKKPRDILFVCSNGDGSLVRVLVEPNNPKLVTDEELLQLAVEGFSKKFGSMPESIEGPFNAWKGSTRINTKRKKRSYLHVDSSKANYTNEVCLASYNDWEVTGRCIANPDQCVENYNPSMGKVFFVKFKTSSTPGKKTVPTPKFISEFDLANINKIE